MCTRASIQTPPSFRAGATGSASSTTGATTATTSATSGATTTATTGATTSASTTGSGMGMCTTNADCGPLPMECAYLIADKCNAKGLCVMRPLGSPCGAIILENGCGCSGQAVMWKGGCHPDEPNG